MLLVVSLTIIGMDGGMSSATPRSVFVFIGDDGDADGDDPVGFCSYTADDGEEEEEKEGLTLHQHQSIRRHQFFTGP